MRVVIGSAQHERLERSVRFSGHETVNILVQASGPGPVHRLRHSFAASRKENRVNLYPKCMRQSAVLPTILTYLLHGAESFLRS